MNASGNAYSKSNAFAYLATTFTDDTLGQGGAGRVLVAMTGRVKVKADVTRRPIRVGDLLVASSRPGVAMRSQPIRVGGALIHRPGTIIGKALEPLAKGEGEILVLLSLQ